MRAGSPVRAAGSPGEGLNGNELWISDGTAAGTTLVKDIVPGMLGSIYPGNNVLTQVMIPLSRSAALAASDGSPGSSCGRRTASASAPCWCRTSSAGLRHPPATVRAGGEPGLLHRRRARARRRGLGGSLAALDVSLEEQLDELIEWLDATVLESVRLPASLNALLTSTRGEVGHEHIAGQFAAARAHLVSFIRAVQDLVARDRLTAAQAQPLLDGAAAILEQIEGNHPKVPHADGNAAR